MLCALVLMCNLQIHLAGERGTNAAMTCIIQTYDCIIMYICKYNPLMVFYTFHAYTAQGGQGVAHGPSKQETPTINMYAVQN